MDKRRPLRRMWCRVSILLFWLGVAGCFLAGALSRTSVSDGLVIAAVAAALGLMALSAAVKRSSRMARRYSSSRMKPLRISTRPSRANMYPAPWGLFRNMARMAASPGWRTPDLDTQMMHM